MILNTKRFLTLTFSISSAFLFAQDKIFKTDGDTILGKVVEVSEGEVKFKKQNNPESPYYAIRSGKVDSIVYANGTTDVIASLFFLKRQSTNLKTKNTFSFDLLGAAHYSVTFWYERRVWQNRIGIRIPLYLSYGQNYSPGFGSIDSRKSYTYVDKGFACAIGINPKFYFNKHKVIRVFAGPEADVGYTSFPKTALPLIFITPQIIIEPAMCS